MDIKNFIALWRKLAQENGLKGVYFIAMCNSTTTIKRTEDGTYRRVVPNLESSAAIYKEFLELGFDGINSSGKSRAEMIYGGRIRRNIRFVLQKKLPFMPSLKYNYP